jgi:glycosyltransferase involved in cell wall biosynthesis
MDTMTQAPPRQDLDDRVKASDITLVRVASVPADHVYVRHLAPARAGSVHPEVERLPDPDPADPSRAAGARWWPPVMLEPEWVRNHGAFDVFHVQFGFDARSPEQLRRLIAEVHRRGAPFVYTAHDLRNPHHDTRDAHDAHLEVIMAEADHIVTLTPGAAGEIHSRWGRRAQVIPHPHVVDFDTMGLLHAVRTHRHARADGAFRIGVHVKSLRASMNPEPVIRALLELVRSLPEVVLQVDGHRDLLLPGGEHFDPGLSDFLFEAGENGEIDLRVHDFFSDAELWEYLAALDVSVLPYRFGTHSGWLEACHDLGTTVVAPDCGYYREQGPVIEYSNGDDGFDADSLRDAALRAYRERPLWMAGVGERRRQRQAVAGAHAALYEQLLK